MTVESFVENYYLHDSYIVSAEHHTDPPRVLLLIDLAFWMQESYRAGDPETGVIRVEFHDVDQYVCEGGDPAGTFVGILGSEYKDGLFVLKLFDDAANEYFEMQIEASSVTVTVV